MLSLVNPEQANVSSAEKDLIVNKIIAAGLNSLVAHVSINANPNTDERKIIDLFISQSFDKIMPCWGMLDDRIKFHIFKSNISEFEQYMLEKSRGSNV